MARTAETINVENYDRLEVHPNEVRLGDRFVTISERTGRIVKVHEPVDEYFRNPRGCPGKTHIGDACYDNITTVTVVRKKPELLGESL